MAVRLNPKQDERTRSAIQTSQLVNRLQAFALQRPDPSSIHGKVVEMTADQVRAATALLAKTLPDLKSVEHSAGDGFTGAFVLLGHAEAKEAPQWAIEHSPTEGK